MDGIPGYEKKYEGYGYCKHQLSDLEVIISFVRTGLEKAHK